MKIDKQDLIKSLDEGLEELVANKDNLESNFNQAMELYPKSKLLKKWKKTYEKSFQFKQKKMVEEEKESNEEEKENENKEKEKEEKEKKDKENEDKKEAEQEKNEKKEKAAEQEANEQLQMNIEDEFRSPYHLIPVDPRTELTKTEKDVANWLFSFRIDKM